MAEHIAQKPRWYSRPAPNEHARIRLICLPYAGGGAAAFRPWVEHLPLDIELCLVHLPGRESRVREPAYSSAERLVEELSEALEPLLDRPYAIFGHSMGAVVGFALTHRLQELGMPRPEQLFVSARRAPHTVDPDPPIHHLPDAAFVASIIRRYDGIPKALLVNVDMLRLYLPTLRADLALIETYNYVHTTPLDCPITAFGGWEDSRASQVDLSDWRDLTSSDFQLRMFPGGHFFIQSAREQLLSEITKTLSPSSLAGNAPPMPVPSYVEPRMNP